MGHARVEIALVEQAVVLQQGHATVLPAVSTAKMFILPPLDGDAAGGVVHPLDVDVDGVFQRQQVGEVLAPLCRHHSALIQIVVEPCRAQIVLRGDAVQIKVREGPRPAVIVHDGEGRAADRVGAAETSGNALAEGRLARAKPAGKGDERPGARCCATCAPVPPSPRGSG